jgi:hypothetical protein
VQAALLRFLREHWGQRRKVPEGNPYADWDRDSTKVAQVMGFAAGTAPPHYNEISDQAYPAFYRAMDAAIWSFVRRGILYPRPRGELYEFNLSPLGRLAMESEEIRFPLDASRTADRFAAEFSAVHDSEVIERYLRQAALSVQHDLNLAGATMLGCAYEKALLQIADAICAKYAPNYSIQGVTSAHRESLEAHRSAGTGKFPPIFKIADAVEAVLRSVPLPKDEKFWVSSSFGNTFFYVRTLRNAAGHPSGAEVPLEDVVRHLSFFLADYSHIQRIIATL